jgi:toxin ParE1/3/4
MPRWRPSERYLIFYRTLPDGIEVIRVLHGMRDLDRIFGEQRDDDTETGEATG